jgi:hypothetical protein
MLLAADAGCLQHGAPSVVRRLHRARDHLLVTGVEPASEFLDDLTAPR